LELGARFAAAPGSVVTGSVGMLGETFFGGDATARLSGSTLRFDATRAAGFGAYVTAGLETALARNVTLSAAVDGTVRSHDGLAGGGRIGLRIGF
jgi:hypothetical protein